MINKHQLANRYAIVGIGEAGLGKAAEGETALSLQCQAARSAMLDAGLVPGDIDAVFAHWDDRATALLVSEYLGIQPRFVDNTVVGGQSNITHLVHAIAAIEAGLCDTALITYGSTQRLDRSRKAGGMNQEPRNPVAQFVQPYGMLSPIGFYAMQAQLHMHRYGTKPEDLGEIALASRKWAQLNPNAFAHDDLTMEQYLAAPMLADPLRKFDICQVTDGAGAMILTRADRARDLKQQPVMVRGFSEKFRHHLTPFGSDDWIDNKVLSTIANDALAMAQLDRKDLDLVQIYDAFTINVLLGLESLGFCEPGEAGMFIRDGRIAPGGDFPLNTSGGGLSFNHSGMFGMQLMIEAIRQLRGECGARQVPEAKSCLVQAGGMVMSAYMVMVLGTE
ncbi:acetyl-CoA acetyltransferase [Paraburkholderia sp. BL10I2N1]|uniref:acetyl-CoA acetyltransferase n=1 Tax=Paraburkholderia sp. BL10I2N1 TaxID=1938796 RepID=UPI00105DA012|nr:acetyl-CoA acetyltransferase [Paraburkholderia sp. BL10I2N1]TDN59128.1 acetyl-CoA C-acetyltransferase [Paraburkholderia sp. BL10I2N1]